MAELIVHSEVPFNAEPALRDLVAAFRTPERHFYVRSHGPVPAIDPAGFQLDIGGTVANPLQLDLDEIRQRFEIRSIEATLQCAGNRRGDMNAHRSVEGDPWGPGAIGNAEWTGVGLSDLLGAAGTDARQGRHVIFHCFDACDLDGKTFRYAVSIPLSKALDGSVLLAFAMNGEPLTPEHGAPLRAIVPGYAGVRSAKWLAAVTVADAPAETPIQRVEYHLHPPRIDARTARASQGILIDVLPLNSAICTPADGAALPAGRQAVAGWAYCGDRAVTRVDLSIDGGESWIQADLGNLSAGEWTWVLWSTMVDLPTGEHELCVRAWDSAGQTQPASAEDVWNYKGYLTTAWHRIRVRAHQERFMNGR